MDNPMRWALIIVSAYFIVLLLAALYGEYRQSHDYDPMG